jgi:hypothetical protein
VNDDDGNWPKQLLMGLAAVGVVALVVGGIVSVIALAAANFAGVGSDPATSSEESSLYIPSPSSRPAEPAQQPSTPTASDQPQTPPSTTKQPKPKQPKPVIRLSASRRVASTYQRVYLSGSYRGGNGARLLVQRYEGHWVEFPVSATVRGGHFETYVESGQKGPNRFRVVDPATGRKSQPVTVTLR